MFRFVLLTAFMAIVMLAPCQTSFADQKSFQLTQPIDQPDQLKRLILRVEGVQAVSMFGEIVTVTFNGDKLSGDALKNVFLKHDYQVTEPQQSPTPETQ